MCSLILLFFFFKQKTAYEMRISDWSSDVCSSDLRRARPQQHLPSLAVDDDEVALAHLGADADAAPDHRDLQGAGDDGDVGSRRAVLQHHRAQPVLVDRKSVV